MRVLARRALRPETGSGIARRNRAHQNLTNRAQGCLGATQFWLAPQCAQIGKQLFKLVRLVEGRICTQCGRLSAHFLGGIVAEQHDLEWVEQVSARRNNAKARALFEEKVDYSQSIRVSVRIEPYFRILLPFCRRYDMGIAEFTKCWNELRADRPSYTPGQLHNFT